MTDDDGADVVYLTRGPISGKAKPSGAIPSPELASKRVAILAPGKDESIIDDLCSTHTRARTDHREREEKKGECIG